MNTSRLLYLDGLRGFAAISVLFYHYSVPFSSFSSIYWFYPFTSKIAVYLFFLLSGYVLYLFCKRYNVRLTYFFSFLVSRFLRLSIPVFGISILIFICLSILPRFSSFDAYPSLHYFFEPYRYSLSYPINLASSFKFSFLDIFVSSISIEHVIPPAWTLKSELYGSLLVFFYYLLLSPRLFNSDLLYNFVKYSLPLLFLVLKPSLGVFLIGALFASEIKPILSFFSSPLIKGPLPSTIVLIGFILLSRPWPFALSSNQLSQNLIAFSSIFLFIFLFISLPIQALLSSSLFQFLGAVSFPLYLVHVPIYALWSGNFAAYLYEVKYISPTLIPYVVFFVFGVLSVCVSFLLLPLERFAVFASRYFRSF